MEERLAARVNGEKERHLKSGCRCNMEDLTVIRPTIFLKYTNVISGMSTKRGDKFQSSLGANPDGVGSSIDGMNQKSFFKLFGISTDELAIPLQTHSINVRNVDRPGGYENCDALITNVPNVAMVVTVADCVPILLFDPVRNAIGAIHAGWRGAANKIVNRALKKMQEEFNTEPEDILAFIGPSAGVCCYEVGEEVAVKFKNKIVSYNNAKKYIDLKEENAYQLQQGGLVPGNIEISRHCTICEVQLFHSFRRDGKIAGRMTAFICLKS